jgi:hypothetical protein
MELHAATRGERTAGITGLTVAANERRKGYAKALLTEVIRRLRDEMVTRVEVTIREDNTPALALFRALNFEQFDTGVVYRKVSAGGETAASKAETRSNPLEPVGPGAGANVSWKSVSPPKGGGAGARGFLLKPRLHPAAGMPSTVSNPVV